MWNPQMIIINANCTSAGLLDFCYHEFLIKKCWKVLNNLSEKNILIPASPSIYFFSPEKKESIITWFCAHSAHLWQYILLVLIFSSWTYDHSFFSLASISRSERKTKANTPEDGRFELSQQQPVKKPSE